MAQPGPIREPAFDPRLFDIRHVVDLALLTRNETRDHRTSEFFRASSLGYCMRRQILERLGVERLRASDGFRTMFIGDAIHNSFQRLLRDAGLVLAEEFAMTDHELGIKGHVDLLWGGEVQPLVPEELEGYSPQWIEYLQQLRSTLRLMYQQPFPVTLDELKSAHDYSAKKMYAEGPSFHHKLQAGIYGYLATAESTEVPEVVRQSPPERIRLSVISKSDGKMALFEVREDHIDAAFERASRLAEYWSTQVVPNCTCGDNLKWEPDYCIYGTGTKGDCCPDALLDSIGEWPGEEPEDGES